MPKKPRKERLKPYMGYDRIGGVSECAVLIFAHNFKEARKLAWHCLSGWMWETEWIDVTARWLREEYFYKYADQKKIDDGVAHTIDDPPVCKGCELWGVSDLNGDRYCQDCEIERKRAG